MGGATLSDLHIRTNTAGDGAGTSRSYLRGRTLAAPAVASTRPERRASRPEERRTLVRHGRRDRPQRRGEGLRRQPVGHDRYVSHDQLTNVSPGDHHDPVTVSSPLTRSGRLLHWHSAALTLDSTPTSPSRRASSLSTCRGTHRDRRFRL
ncbi:hypothetical protein C9J85_03075 [Haloferax sp. wsp5]|nr:hypothetical protein C9J85_03075 [Haloferax sp. wsp5]